MNQGHENLVNPAFEFSRKSNCPNFPTTTKLKLLVAIENTSVYGHGVQKCMYSCTVCITREKCMKLPIIVRGPFKKFQIVL